MTNKVINRNSKIKKRFPPSVFIQDGLDVLGISWEEFGKRSGILETELKGIIYQTVAITPKSAIQISSVIGGKSQTWLNLQASWDKYKKEMEEIKNE